MPTASKLRIVLEQIQRIVSRLSTNDELNGVRSEHHLLQPVFVDAERRDFLDTNSFDEVNDRFWKKPKRGFGNLDPDLNEEALQEMAVARVALEN